MESGDPSVVMDFPEEMQMMCDALMGSSTVLSYGRVGTSDIG